MMLSNGNVTDYTAEPALIPMPDRIPVSDADRRGVVDPMTSALTHVDGTGDPVGPGACNRKVSVFDGRVRYDLQSEFKRVESVKAEKGYQGAAAVCALYFRPISGYVPDRAAIKYLIALRDAESLVPIAGTRVLVPFRFAMPPRSALASCKPGNSSPWRSRRARWQRRSKTGVAVQCVRLRQRICAVPIIHRT